ncbi:MAG: TolC family protein [Balneolales bacterium]
MSSRPLTILMALSGIAVIIFGGCRTSKEVSSPVKVPESFSESGTSLVSSQWWKNLGDDHLNAAIDTAMQSNFNLLTAWERLREAQAVTKRESSALFPELDASATGEVIRSSDRSQESEEIQLGLSSFYEIDLWGRIQSRVDAEKYRAQATLLDYQTAALSLSGEIAITWYQLADAQNQLALVVEQIETNLTMLKLLINRFETGLIPSVDVLRQQQLVEATREQKLYEETNVQVLEHQLTILLGQTPQSEVEYRPDDLPELTPIPDAGVPADLVQRRPDVQSAYSLLLASDRDLAFAINNQFPKLTLSATLTTPGTNSGSVFDEWALSFMGNLLAPIFYGSQLRAEVDRNEAITQQRIYEYGQTILIAFQEVEDALIQEKKQVQSIQSIERQLELATKTFEQLRFQYLNGSGNYLDVLTALDGIQQLRRDLLTARLTLVEYRISLYRALAGSFETEMMADE